MNRDELYDHIFKRRSVRKYLPGPLDESKLSEVRSFLENIEPLIPGIQTESRMFENKDVKGLFKTDAPHFLGFFSEPKEGYLINAGFMLQQLDLFLSAEGIGSCYQGMAKTVKGVEGPADLEYVIMISFGLPKEELHRKSAAEFKRQPMSKISTVEDMDDIMEAARLAPSGVNNQPWYFTGGNGLVHAYCSKALIGDALNRINVGIALCHIWLAAMHFGKKVEFVKDKDAEEKTPKGHNYMISARLS